MRFDTSRPIFLQIMEEVKRRVMRGDFKSGERAPSVRELAKILKVNPNTVAKAYYELEREGLLFTKRGQGTFITQDKRVLNRERERMVRGAIKKLLKELKGLGIDKDEIEGIIREEIWRL